MSSNPTRYVLLRGLGRESGHWGPFVERFQKQFAGDEVLSIDYPGVADREKEKAPVKMANLAAGIVSAIPNWEPRQTVVVGHSLGGMVALSLAGKYQDLKGIVLINTSVGGVNRWQERIELPSAMEMVQVFATPDARMREERIMSLVSREPDRHGQILQTWIRLAETRPIHRQVILKQLWAASRFRLPKQVSPPTLLLAGLGDKLVNPRCSKALGEKLKVDVRYHPWAGHELSLDDPEWVLTEVQRWQTNRPS